MKITIGQLDRICLSVLVIGTFICAYAAYSYGSKKKQQFLLEQELLSEQLKQVNLAQANLHELKAVLDATRKELGTLNERIPESGKIGVLLKQIDALMKHQRLNLISLQPLAPQNQKMYIQNPIRMVFEGAFSDIYPLFGDLERMNRIIVMEKMSITKDVHASMCRVDLTANVFEQRKDR